MTRDPHLRGGSWKRMYPSGYTTDSQGVGQKPNVALGQFPSVANTLRIWRSVNARKQTTI